MKRLLLFLTLLCGLPTITSAAPISWVLEGEVTGTNSPGSPGIDQLFARYPVGTDIRIEMHIDDYARDSCANPGSSFFGFGSAAAVTMGGDSGLYAVYFEINSPAGNCPFGPHMESFDPLSGGDIRIIKQAGTVQGYAFILPGGPGGGWLTYNCVVCGEGVTFTLHTESYSVAEPASATLIGLGLWALVVRQRRNG